MKINKLTLINFRNYSKEAIELGDGINIINGYNAQGKTNLLESIYVLSVTKSFRSEDSSLVRQNEMFYKLACDVLYKNDQKQLILIGSKEGKKAFINGVEAKKLSDFIGKLNIVLFSPDDCSLLKAGPAERRKLLDYSLMQISKKYVDDYQALKKQLKLRNDYLKYLLPKIEGNNIPQDEMIDILTENFISLNKSIENQRREFLERLEKITATKYMQLSGTNEVVRFEYVSNSLNSLESYKSKLVSDIYSGSTQNGCHRDDIKFYKNNSLFEESASQGELRMLALSLKLGLADILEEIKGDSPVVLLDDVLSELDKNHQNKLLQMLKKTTQVVITTTDIYKIGQDILSKSKLFNINKGIIKEVSHNG